MSELELDGAPVGGSRAARCCHASLGRTKGTVVILNVRDKTVT